MFIFQQNAFDDHVFSKPPQEGPKLNEQKQDQAKIEIEKLAKLCVSNGLKRNDYFKKALNIKVNENAVQTAIEEFYKTMGTTQEQLNKAGEILYKKILDLLPKTKESQEIAQKTVLYAFAFTKIKDDKTGNLLKENSDNYWDFLSSSSMVKLYNENGSLNTNNLAFRIVYKKTQYKQDIDKNKITELAGQFLLLHRDPPMTKFVFEQEKTKFSQKLDSENYERKENFTKYNNEIRLKQVDQALINNPNRVKEIINKYHEQYKNEGLTEDQIAQILYNSYQDLHKMGKDDICSAIYDYMKESKLFEHLERSKQEQMRITEMNNLLEKMRRANLINPSESQDITEIYTKSLELAAIKEAILDKEAGNVDLSDESRKKIKKDISRIKDLLGKLDADERELRKTIEETRKAFSEVENNLA